MARHRLAVPDHAARVCGVQVRLSGGHFGAVHRHDDPGDLDTPMEPAKPTIWCPVLGQLDRRSFAGSLGG